MSTRLVVLASGRGSNLEAILAAIDAGRCRAEVVAVLSDKHRCTALETAEARGLATRSVPFRKAERARWDQELAAATAEYDPDLVVLAGFMRIVGPAFLARFGGRCLNVHPALLPSFPGLHAPRQAIEAGVRLSGCTVHLVDAGVDTGPILAQVAVPVLPGDDADTLHARIQSREHALLPLVIDALATGALDLETDRVRDEVRTRSDAHLASPIRLDT